LPELELTEPRIATFTSEQRAEFVSLMTSMIIGHRLEQRLQQARAMVATNGSYQSREIQAPALHHDPLVRTTIGLMTFRRMSPATGR
jgi:hypothetical protein